MEISNGDSAADAATLTELALALGHMSPSVLSARYGHLLPDTHSPVAESPGTSQEHSD